jgi:sugar phosphate isomerase/epimerase
MRQQPFERALGTMVTTGFAPGLLEVDLDLAARLGARCVEILPDWRKLTDPAEVSERVGDRGMTIHSVHGCWGGQTIRAERVDLSHPDPRVRSDSLDDLKRCLDWLVACGGRHLVVHPGGLSNPEDAPARRAALAHALEALADHARPIRALVCVENMPPGVHPGSRMADLAELVNALARPELALAIDTGHANLNATADAETRAAGPLLRTTHVHDNNGHTDAHLPPGAGTIDWSSWLLALDQIGYNGPVMLECIRCLRQTPSSLDDALLRLLGQLTEGKGARS